ncbi:MAG: AMP-binding protein [Chloroflexota bacterium]
MQTLATILYQNSLDRPQKQILHLLRSGKEDVHITYQALAGQAQRFVRAYSQAGLKPGEVVVLILQHGEELIYAYWGAVLHGAIPSIMPFLTEKLQPERYRADLASLVEITQPAAIVTYAEFYDEVHSALEPGTSVRQVIVAEQIPDANESQPIDLQGLLRTGEDIVLLQHSSGTTGLQKGVALANQAVTNQLNSYRQALKLNAQDVVVSWLPLYHDMGLIAGFLMPILESVPLVLMSPFDWVRAPYRLMQAVSHYRGTLTWLPNFAFNFCAQKTRDRHLEGVDLSSWRGVINCSEPVRWESHQMFLERFQPYGLQPQALGACYAMAENVFAVTQTQIRSGSTGADITVDEIDQEAFMRDRLALPVPLRPDTQASTTGRMKMLSNGAPIQGVEVRILGEDRQPLPERQVGEIALRSHCMLTAYYNRPDVTAQAFLDGWYLTGDYGYQASGELYVTGRKKDLIIVGGKNVYPQDLEYLAMQIPGIHAGRVAALGIYNQDLGTEEVVIVAEVDGLAEEKFDFSKKSNFSDSAEQQSIAQAVRDAITRNSAIAVRHVHLVAPGWLIKTSSGKVARPANREKYLAEMNTQS